MGLPRRAGSFPERDFGSLARRYSRALLYRDGEDPIRNFPETGTPGRIAGWEY